MPSFVVDPLLSTTPLGDAGASELARWLVMLEGWLVAQESSPFEWRHFFSCTRALVDIGRFPAFDSLRAASKAAGIDVNVGGLLQRITRFFQDENRDLQAITATQCVVVAEDEPTIVPPELLTRSLPELRGPLREGLLCLACDKAEGEPFARETRLVTSPFEAKEKEIAIAGTIALIDPESMTARRTGRTLRGRIPALFSPEGLDAFHHEALLAGGEDGFCALITTIAASAYPGSPLLPSSVGSQLWQSMHKTGILEDTFATGKLLRICAAIVADKLDEVNVDRRPKRETDSPSSPQQTRTHDQAKAWRLTITKAGAGYRLHYWHVPRREEEGQAEKIELANVLKERDRVVIPEN